MVLLGNNMDSNRQNRPADSAPAEIEAQCYYGSLGGGHCMETARMITEKPPRLADVHPSFYCGVPSTAARLCANRSTIPADAECSLGLEHLKIAIQGSNCPGCTRKIFKSLESVPFLWNLKLHSMPLQVEFDFDITKVSVRDIMRMVRKKTGRPWQRVGEGWQELRIAVRTPGASKSLVTSTPPPGGMDIECLGAELIAIKYDAKLIGARDLLMRLNKLSTDKGDSLRLAPFEAQCQAPPSIRRTGFLTIISSMLTLPVLILTWAPLPKRELEYGIASLVLATLVQIVVAGPLYPKAIRSLFLHQIDMDFLVVLSTSITYVFSVSAFICAVIGSPLTSGMYFETSTLLVTLIMLGRFMADFTCHQIVVSQSIRSLQPRAALLVGKENIGSGDSKEIDVRLLQFGDIIKVESGRVASTDGIVLCGESEFDESLITGEAKLIKKSKGCAVIAGSTNHSASVRIQVTRLPGDNTISEIADMVEEISHSKPNSQLMADKIASCFVPIVGALATITLLVWILVNTLLRDQLTGLAILHAITYAIAVLVVSCPCAIGLIIPVTQVVAGSIGAQHGVIIRSAELLRTAGKVDHVVFDKTGTLTTEHLSIISEQYCTEPPSYAAAIALALASYSEHPVSRAITVHLESRCLDLPVVDDLEILVGKGIKGTINGEIVRIGNSRWLDVENSAKVQTLISRGLTVLCAVQRDELIAVYGLEATVRPEIAKLIPRLKTRGMKISIMSGDEIEAVHKVAISIGVPLENTWGRCTPREKQQRLKELMHVKGDTVLFCGDGVNDAAALSQASVGLHVSNTTGFTQSTADAVLTKASLNGILVLMDLSRDCYRQIIFGFCWSAFYNVFAIMFAAGAFVNIRLAPEYAGLGEAVSVLPVILTPLRLKWKKYQ